ncbi:lipopolysaccharide biosynthesis protein [Chryseobacterium indologenes]|uniref:lipopolysaccharide biosynthesis protein n=1 Tax=Chryseobacterium indologenes TaxID=253 RepID=UPI001BCDD945|nr:oligosaccharide flippase family protein [Chryseobacterium indologenes]
MNSNTLLKSTLIYTVGNFGSKILSFLLIPIYSYYLSRKELGEYDLVLTSVNLLVPFVSLQMNEAIYRWFLDKENEKENYIDNIFKQCSVLLLISFISFELLLYLAGIFYHIPYQKELSLLIISSCLLPFFQQILRGLGLTRFYSFIGIINSFFIFSFSLLFLLTDIFHDKVQGIFYALFISNFIAILLMLFKVSFLFKKYVSIKINYPLQKQILFYSLPLILNSISWWVINASDRYIILKFLTIEDNGIYAVSARLPAILTIFNTVFMLAWQDMAISGNDPNNPFFSKLFNKYIAVNIGLSTILIAATPLITEVLFDSKFYESWKYATILYIGSCFSSISGFLGAIYLKTKSTKGIFITSMIGALVNVFISMAFIKYIGLYAPALGTFVSFFVMFVIRYRQTAEILKLDIDIKSFIIQLLVVFGIIILLYVNSSHLISISLTVLSLCLFGYFNKDIFKKVFNKLNSLKK